MLKIVVMVSGGGTNLQAIIDSISKGRISNTQITGVISSKPDVYALTRAKENDIPCCSISKKSYTDTESYQQALLKALSNYQPDLIVLAGYLPIVPAVVIEMYRNRIINIHPSLIPSFCGTGCYGIHVHEAVLERGVKITGATVHFVDEGTDTGPILLQKAVLVENGDTPQDLQQRVMEEAEWVILPRAINAIANGTIIRENQNVWIRE